MMKKKIVSLMTILMMAVGMPALADGDEPAWVGQLRQCSPMTSVTWSHDEFHDVDQVSFTYEQPLDHSNPNGEKFSLRGVIYVPDGVDATTCVNELYFSGYALSFPDDAYVLSSDFFGNVNQIARRYNGSFVELEHRYYDKSVPTDPWTKLEYLNANEAAQDFHAVIQALKKVMQGKWAMNGVSKGGITTSFQYAYYPEDADVYMANCSPYFDSMTDKRMYRYIANNGWTPELRNRITEDRRAILKDADAVKEFQKIYQKDHPEATDEYCQRRFYTMIMEQYGYAFRSVSRNQIEQTLNDNDSMMVVYMQKYNVTKSMLNAVRATSYDINAVDTWTYYFQKNGYDAAPKKAPKANVYAVPHFEISEAEWKSDDEVPYYYQSSREMGGYTYDFHYLFTDEADQALADSLQTFFDKNGGDYITVLFPFLKGIEYDGGALNDFTLGKVKEAAKPILFLYGEDDCFTGCQIDDQYLNGNTTRKYTLPAQNHGVKINRDTTQKDEIWSFFDRYLDPNYDNIQSPNDATQSTRFRKMIQGNQLVIVSGDKKYSVSGQTLK